MALQATDLHRSVRGSRSWSRTGAKHEALISLVPGTVALSIPFSHSTWKNWSVSGSNQRPSAERVWESRKAARFLRLLDLREAIADSAETIQPVIMRQAFADRYRSQGLRITSRPDYGLSHSKCDNALFSRKSAVRKMATSEKPAERLFLGVIHRTGARVTMRGDRWVRLGNSRHFHCPSQPVLRGAVCGA